MMDNWLFRLFEQIKWTSWYFDLFNVWRWLSTIVVAFFGGCVVGYVLRRERQKKSRFEVIK